MSLNRAKKRLEILQPFVYGFYPLLFLVRVDFNLSAISNSFRIFFSNDPAALSTKILEEIKMCSGSSRVATNKNGRADQNQKRKSLKNY